MDFSLDPSFLISKLVYKFKPRDIKAIKFASEVLKTINFFPCQVSNNSLQNKWLSEIENQGENYKSEILILNMRKLCFHLHKPQAIFLLLDQIHKDMKEEKENEIKQPKSLLPIDFLYVLQGIEGNNKSIFQWNPEEEQFFLIKSLPFNYMHVATEVGLLGKIAHILRNILSNSTEIKSLFFQQILSSVHQCLINYDRFVSSIEDFYSQLTPYQLESLLFSEPVKELKATFLICNTVKGFKGGNLLNALSTLAKHGDPSISKMANLFYNEGLKALETMIRKWTIEGWVDDPFDEFFIKTNNEMTLCRLWWTKRFTLVKEEAPKDFSHETLECIFNAGRALNFLRQWTEPISLEDAIDQKYEIDIFVRKASEIASYHLLKFIRSNNQLSFIMHYLSNIMFLIRGDFSCAMLSQSPDKVKMSQFFNEYARQCFPNEYLEFKESNLADIQIEQIKGSWNFKFIVNDPLSVIFSQHCCKLYNYISSFFLMLKKYEQKILFAKRDTKKNPNEYLLYYKILSLMKIFTTHFYSKVLIPRIDKLTQVFETASSLDEILKAHDKFLTSLSNCCYLTPNLKPISDAFAAVFNEITISLNQLSDPSKSYKNFITSVHNLTSLLSNNSGSRSLADSILSRFPS